MRPLTTNLKIGEEIKVTVEEVMTSGALIVNAEGYLFRVTNESDEKFKAGQLVTLTVRGLNPLLFSIQSRPRLQFERFA